MSLNQLLSQEKKQWMNINVNGLSVKGVFSYKNPNKANGRILQLDNDNKPQWVAAVDGRLANTFSALINSKTMVEPSFTSSTYFLYYGNPGANYEYTQGDAFVRVKTAGLYVVYATIFANLFNVKIETAIVIQDAIQRSSQSTTLPIGNLGRKKTGSVAYGIFDLQVDDRISVVFKEATGKLITSDREGSFLTIIKIT